MIRKAFVMGVNAGAEEEYERRHRPIWPELERTLLEHGVRTYSIFLHAETEVCRRWWKHMREIMPTNADDSPVAMELREVFYLARTAAQ